MCRISGAAGDQIGRDRRRRRRKEGKKKKEERKVVKGECRTVTSSRTTQVTIIERWRLPSVPRERKKKKINLLLNCICDTFSRIQESFISLEKLLELFAIDTSGNSLIRDS